MREIWKEIPKTRGKYWVSNTGHVKSFYAKDPNGRILKERTNYNKGYLYIGLYTRRGYEKFYVHRLVAEAFCRKRFNKTQVDHLNGNRLDNRAENLEWVTPGENMRRAMAMGTQRFYRPGHGSNVRLTESQVISLKQDVRAGKMTRQEVMDKYGIADITVDAIMKKRRWRHIP